MMSISLKKNKAQAISEYAITIALVVVVMITMTTFIRRVLQARIRDARNYMISSVNATYSATRGNDEATPSGVSYEYEPYYANQVFETTREINDQSRFAVEDKGGTFKYIYSAKNFDETTTTNAQSIQAPPRDAN